MLVDAINHRLPEGAKRMLQIGAVVGREFGWELINAVAALPEQELRTQQKLDRALETTHLINLVLPPGWFPLGAEGLAG